ncbi:tetratricopeptide repeat protein [Streptomyces sp. Inha503]|uniref:tetratricopeptide repeat protein n=1 Tax=Streptomyces sp. Inha503 TaxID=3383314 RepID=UPI00399F6517
METSGNGDTENTLAGGSVHGAVIQGRDFHFHGPVVANNSSERHAAAHLHSDRWPIVNSWNALAAGVHQSRQGDDGNAVPPYVERVVDLALRDRLVNAAESGGLVLVIGDSTAGKTRTAYEALRATLPGYRILVPEIGDDFDVVSDAVANSECPCIVWLDDLEDYLGPQGLSPRVVHELARLKTPVVATMRTQQYETFRPRQEAAVHSGNEIWYAKATGTRVLKLAAVIELERVWDAEELRRAQACSDPRIIDAVAHHGPFGIAEYLASGPALLHEWHGAYRAGANPRGAALVAAAVDLSRTGLRSPYRLSALRPLHEAYLMMKGGSLLRPESLESAVSWASQIRFGVTSMLLPVTEDGWAVFDYLVDHTSSEIPSSVWGAALAYATSDSERFIIGVNASRAAPDVALSAWRPLADNGVAAAEFNVGVLLRELGKAEEAELWLRRALASGYSDAAINLGILLGETGRVEEGEKTLRLVEGSPLGAMNLGILLASTGRTEEAEVTYRRALDGGFPYATPLANLLMIQGRYKEAEEMFLRSLGAGDSDAAVNFGNLLLEMGRVEDAEAMYRQGVETSSPSADYNLGLLLAKLGRDEEAARMYRSAIDSGNIEAAFNLGNLMVKSKNLGEAAELFRLAVRSGHTGAAVNLGNLLADKGRIEEAEKMYRHAESLGDPSGALNLGILLCDLGRPEDAENAYRRAKEAGSVDAVVNLGALLMDFGRHDEAEQLFREALFAGQSDMAVNLGVLFSRLGRIEEAERMFKDAIDFGYTSVSVNLGNMLMAEGRLEEAEMTFREALSNGNLGAANNLSAALLRAGRIEDAEYCLRQAMEAGDSQAAANLAILLRHYG